MDKLNVILSLVPPVLLVSWELELSGKGSLEAEIAWEEA